MIAVTTMSQAKAAGLRFYFTGKPCSRGHIALRFTSCCSCVTCVEQSSERWRNLNRERENERMRRHRAANPAATAASCAAWRQRNPHIFLQSYSTWRANNLEKARAAVRRWQTANREAVLANAHAYRGRAVKAEGSFCADDVARIFSQQRGRCAYCRTQFRDNNFQIDHIISLAAGGMNWPRNLQLLCRSCNAKKWKTDPIIYAQRQGMLL